MNTHVLAGDNGGELMPGRMYAAGHVEIFVSFRSVSLQPRIFFFSRTAQRFSRNRSFPPRLPRTERTSEQRRGVTKRFVNWRCFCFFFLSRRIGSISREAPLSRLIESSVCRDGNRNGSESAGPQINRVPPQPRERVSYVYCIHIYVNNCGNGGSSN